MEKVLVTNYNPNGLPKYETDGSSGMDLKAWIDPKQYLNEKGNISIKGSHGGAFFKPNKDNTLELIIRPQARALVKTGVHIAMPEYMEAQVRPRSGLALKHGITCTNSPGTIDSSYRGDIGVIVHNTSDENFVIKDGDRIAQLVFALTFKVKFKQVLELPESVRGEGGFGHTGVK